MFAAASGARLAHRHNKATIKKQLCTNNVEGVQVNYKAFQKHQHAKYSEPPGIHGQRKPQRCHNYTSKLYSSDSESVIKLSSSYIDLHGRIPKLGHVDFEGKAAWQDRELGYDVDRRESVCAQSEAAATHRIKQKEAQKRWVKRNRIHDSTFGDISSDEEEAELYGPQGVQNAAANALLYIGLGTMCIGMVIAFVGTGEKGFKTIELRLIGPSLIGAGVMIIILRVMLCVCPSKCLRLNKHKHKNSTNKLNSEEECEWRESIECLKKKEEAAASAAAVAGGEGERRDGGEENGKKPEAKKRVSIVEMAATKSGTSEVCESSSSRFLPTRKASDFGRPSAEKPPADASSLASDLSHSSRVTRASWTEADGKISDASIGSIVNGFLNSDSFDSDLSSKTVKNASKFESHRSPKNAKTEIVLNPSNLNDFRESD